MPVNFWKAATPVDLSVSRLPHARMNTLSVSIFQARLPYSDPFRTVHDYSTSTAAVGFARKCREFRWSRRLAMNSKSHSGCHRHTDVYISCVCVCSSWSLSADYSPAPSSVVRRREIFVRPPSPAFSSSARHGGPEPQAHPLQRYHQASPTSMRATYIAL